MSISRTAAATAAPTVGARVWVPLVVVGLVGQLAWTVENMYLNVFVYETITDNPTVLATTVAASAVAVATPLVADCRPPCTRRSRTSRRDERVPHGRPPPGQLPSARLRAVDEQLTRAGSAGPTVPGQRIAVDHLTGWAEDVFNRW